MPDRRPDTQMVQVTLSRRAWIVIGLVVLLQIGIFVAQLSLQEDQRSTGDKSLEVGVTQLREALPALRAGRRLSDETLEDLPETRRLTDRSLELARTATPLVRELRNARLEEATRATGALARTLLASDVGAATRAGRTLAESLVRADLPRLSADLSAVVGELTTQQRLRRLLVRSTVVLGEARDRRLVAKTARAAELAPDQFAILKRSMEIQAETLALQREAVAIGREALVVAKEAEKHAESVDRKTGGSFPASRGG